MGDGASNLPDRGSERQDALHLITAARFSGPLPPPQILKEYDRVVPGAARRILVMAEKQADHRRAVESKVVWSDITNSRVGLFCGLIIGIAGLAASTVIAVYGNPQAGVGMGLVTLASLVGVFVYGSRLRVKEREAEWGRRLNQQRLRNAERDA